jgi:lipid-A-disaccharide synthase
VKYYIIAGEASGDLHGANLVEAIKAQDAEAQFRGFGGDKMKAEGVTLFRHYKETAYMGFVEVLKHLRKILKNIDQCKKDIVDYQPDAVILVDYPGFNLRIAPFAKQNGFKVILLYLPAIMGMEKQQG